MSNFARVEGIPSYTGPVDPADAPVTPKAGDPGQPGTPNQPAAQPPADLSVPVPASEGRPAWLPEKFKSPEDLAKAHAELERLLGEKGGQPKAPAKGEKPAAPAADEAGALSDDELQSFDREFQANGRLSEESYAKLAKRGINRGMVDGYIRGQEARAQELMGKVWDATGGQEAYASLVQWATKNVPAEDLRHYNAMVSSGDPEQTLFAVRGMAARYAAAGNVVQRLPTRRIDGANGGGSPPKFRSQHEITLAMSNPRYEWDEAYRADVAARMP